MEFYLQTKIKGLCLLFINIFLLISFIFIILPGLNFSVVKHNIEKDIEANVYLYTELEINSEWGN